MSKQFNHAQIRGWFRLHETRSREQRIRIMQNTGLNILTLSKMNKEITQKFGHSPRVSNYDIASYLRTVKTA